MTDRIRIASARVAEGDRSDQAPDVHTKISIGMQLGLIQYLALCHGYRARNARDENMQVDSIILNAVI